MFMFGYMLATIVEAVKQDLKARKDIKELKKSLIMASISLDYHKQGYHPSKLFIGQKIVSIGNTSFKMLASIFNNEEVSPLVSSLTVIVCFDFNEQKTFPVPAIIRNKINLMN